MTATVVAGTIPFSSTFTLQLNANRLCSPITYTINFGDNTARDVQVPKEQCAKLFTTVLNHQYQRAGTFIATLTSKPQSGTGMTLTKITITAKEPVVSVGTKSASFSIVPSSGSYPLTVAFTLSAGDSQNSAFRYTAQFGDGTSEDFPLSASPKLTHVFTNPGTYVVTVMKRTQCTVNGCTGPAATVGTVNVTAY
jgi:PKD repeat protein